MVTRVKKIYHLRGYTLRIAISTIFVATCLFIDTFFHHSVLRSFHYFQPANVLRCVIGVQKMKPFNEQFGEMLQQHQLAAFIASSQSLSLSSSHVYNKAETWSSSFGSCATRTKVPGTCELNHNNLVISHCEAGDCACLQNHLNHYIQPIIRSCPSVAVIPTNYSTIQFSGCLRNLLFQYISNTTKPPFSYDVLYYRQGEMGTLNPREFDFRQLAYMVRALCSLSERPIVVITNEMTRIPACGDRIIIGAGLSIKEALRVMRYGNHIGVSGDELSVGLMEVAKPGRVVLFRNLVRYYEWVKCEKWTVLGKFGQMYHFDDKQTMKRTVLERPEIEALGYREKVRLLRRDMGLKVPERRWQLEEIVQSGKMNTT